MIQIESTDVQVGQGGVVQTIVVQQTIRLPAVERSDDQRPVVVHAARHTGDVRFVALLHAVDVKADLLEMAVKHDCKVRPPSNQLIVLEGLIMAKCDLDFVVQLVPDADFGACRLVDVPHIPAGLPSAFSWSEITAVPLDNGECGPRVGHVTDFRPARHRKAEQTKADAGMLGDGDGALRTIKQPAARELGQSRARAAG